jgi:hypothetical protein
VERGRVYWMFVVLLKEWKWVGIVLGAWNLRKKFKKKPFGFGSTTFYRFECKA